MAAEPDAVRDREAVRALVEIAAGSRVDDVDKLRLRSYPEADLELGLQLQLRVLDARSRGPVGGWKVALTNARSRDSLGAGVRTFGYILAERITEAPARLSWNAGPNLGVEVEFCLTVGSSLGGADVTTDEARAAVASLSPAFEVVSSRLPSGMGLTVRLANGLNNWGLVIGAGQPPDIDLDARAVTLSRDGVVTARDRTGPALLEDPFESVALLCRALHRFGRRLEPGQRIITGALLPAVRIDGPTSFVGSIEGLGDVEAAFDD